MNEPSNESKIDPLEVPDEALKGELNKGFEDDNEESEGRMAKNDWQTGTPVEDSDYLSSLPDGWSANTVEVGFGSKIKHFVNRRGKRFVSRIDAIRLLTASERRRDREDAAVLVAGLAADGWLQHALLPQGWYAKPACKSSGNALKFLTERLDWFVGLKKAVKLLRTSPDYTAEDLDNLQQFAEQFCSDRRREAVDSTWQEGGQFLPSGWRYKTAHGRAGDYARVLSPDGEVFSSICKALAFAVQAELPEADVTKLREALAYDGWMEVSGLPNWKVRKCKTGRNEHNFLSPAGQVFPSRKTVVAFMRESNTYDDKDIEHIDFVKTELKSQWVAGNHEWLDKDNTVPPGWKIRYFESTRGKKLPGKRKRCYILSPSGEVFQTRAKALQFMIQSQAVPEEEVSFMREQLEHESWVAHPRLPTAWRIKCKTGLGKGKGHCFFTSEGLILSLKAALDYTAQHSDRYTAEDREGLVFVTRGLKEEQAAEQQEQEWRESESVPAGWKVRSVGTGTAIREYFLSPDGLQLAGRVHTIKWLLEQGTLLASPEVISLSAGLEAAGWEDMELLPGWRKKSLASKAGGYKYLSPDYREYGSLARIYHSLRASGTVSTDLLNIVKSKLDAKSLLSNKRFQKKEGKIDRVTYNWEDADYLPKGWKVAERRFRYQNSRTIYLTSGGLLLQHAVLAYQLMTTEGVDDYFLEQMYSRLTEEGWEDDPYLPDGWKLNTDSSQFPDNVINEENVDVLFLTDKNLILTKVEAADLVANSELGERTKSNFFYLLSRLSSRGEEVGWVEDPLLPIGFRLKDVNHGFKRETHVKAANGEIFDSILAAFLFVQNGFQFGEEFTNEDIYKMKIKLKSEGFVESAGIPSGWLICRNSRGNLFELISREGHLHDTLESAMNFMMSEVGEDAGYSDVDILKLEEFCMNEVELYVSSRGLNTTKLETKSESESSSPNKIKTSNARKRKRSGAGSFIKLESEVSNSKRRSSQRISKERKYSS